MPQLASTQRVCGAKNGCSSRNARRPRARRPGWRNWPSGSARKLPLREHGVEQRRHLLLGDARETQARRGRAAGRPPAALRRTGRCSRPRRRPPRRRPWRARPGPPPASCRRRRRGRTCRCRRRSPGAPAPRGAGAVARRDRRRHASSSWQSGPSARQSTSSGHGRSGACQHWAQQRGTGWRRSLAFASFRRLRTRRFTTSDVAPGVELAVDGHQRRQAAGAEAGHDFEAEEAVAGGLAGLDVQRALDGRQRLQRASSRGTRCRGTPGCGSGRAAGSGTGCRRWRRRTPCWPAAAGAGRSGRPRRATGSRASCTSCSSGISASRRPGRYLLTIGSRSGAIMMRFPGQGLPLLMGVVGDLVEGHHQVHVLDVGARRDAEPDGGEVQDAVHAGQHELVGDALGFGGGDGDDAAWMPSRAMTSAIWSNG